MRLTPDSSYPIIILDEPVVVVKEVTTDIVRVLKVTEELIEPKVYVEYAVGDEITTRMCTVIEGETYFPEWDDTTVSDAIKTHLQSQG